MKVFTFKNAILQLKGKYLHKKRKKNSTDRDSTYCIENEKSKTQILELRRKKNKDITWQFSSYEQEIWKTTIINIVF